MRWLFLIMLIAAPAQAQTVMEIDGGSSNFQGSGAGVVLFSQSGETRIQGGLAAGRFVYNASHRTEIHGWSLDLGDTSFVVSGTGQLSLNAPIRGVAAIKEMKKSQFMAFAGALGQITSNPFAWGIERAHLGGGFGYHKQVGSSLTVGTIQAASATQKTSLADMDWKPSCFNGPRPPLAGAGSKIGCWWNHHFEFKGQAGILSNNHQLAGSAEMAFKHFSATGGRASYIFVPQLGTPNSTPASTQLAQHVTVNSGSVSGGVSLLSVGASVFQSIQSTGKSYSLNSTIGWLGLSASTFQSRSRFGKQSGSLLSATERLGLHLSVQEYASKSNGQWNFNYGGGWHSNRWSASISESILYFPALSRSPFRKVLSISIGFRFRSANINASTIALPNGQTNWVVQGGDYVAAPVQVPAIPGTVSKNVYALPSRAHSGKFCAEILVVDEKGDPVSGAAVSIGSDAVFTNPQGRASTKTKKKSNPLIVNADHFLSGDDWMVVSAPPTAEAGEVAKIIVKKKT